MITNQEADILHHASQNGRYVTGDAFVLEMAKRGLLRDSGPWALAGGAHFLTTSQKGRAALNEWGAAQPKPPKRRSASREFVAWRNYREVCGRISFSEFLKNVWPNYKTGVSAP